MWRNEGKWSPSAGVDDRLDRMLIVRIGCAELMRHSNNMRVRESERYLTDQTVTFES